MDTTIFLVPIFDSRIKKTKVRSSVLSICAYFFIGIHYFISSVYWSIGTYSHIVIMNTCKKK